MHLSMSTSQRMEPQMSLRQEQRMEQLARQEARLSRRIELLRAVRGDHYEPRAQCPACSHRLSNLEILKGFTDNSEDTTTGCPVCKTRFQPYLACTPFRAVRIEVAFFCPAQTLERLRGRDQVTPETLEAENSALFRSALFHFGSLVGAFRRLGTTYTLEPAPPSWQEKVRPFLGRLSDTVIAECVGTTTSEVRTIRRRLGVRGYHTRAN